MHNVVDKLLNLESDLVVTITAPLDRRRPGNDEDRIRNVVRTGATVEFVASDALADLGRIGLLLR